MTGPVTAHPKFDPVTGDLLFFGYQPFPPYVTWYRASRDGKLIESRPIDTGLPVMMHDFIATDNYAIFFVCPSVFHLENATAGKPIFAWEPQHGTKIGVMDRKTGDMKWFQDEAFFIFHFLNAYEENGSLIVDGCRMKSLDMSGTSFGGNPPLTWRWNLNLKDGSMKQRQIDDVSNEFPRFDERLAGRKHRYGYFAGGNPGSPEKETRFQALLKRDYQTDKLEVHDLGKILLPASRCLCRATRNRPKTTVGCSRSGTTSSSIGARWSCSTRKTSQALPSRESNCSIACRGAFTAIGCPRNEEGDTSGAHADSRAQGSASRSK